MRSLRARVTLVTVAVAVLAVLVTGIVSAQFVRTSTNADARAQLAAQADSYTPGSLLSTEALVATISPNGTVAGTGSGLVDAVLITRLENRGTLSTVRRLDGEPYIVEARWTSAGGIVLGLEQARIDSIVRDAAGRIALALLIGVAVAIVAGTLLSIWVARPIARTARAARRLASGERGVDLAVRTPTEVADIATSLTALDSALTTSEGRQREFLLSISHELRTPLTAVRGYAEALADGMIAPGEVATVGATLVAETERIDRFVADLLELARLQSDDFSIRRRDVQLSEVLAATAAAWRAHATALGVTLTVSGDAQLTTDAQRVRQLIDGLVENALRVTPEGGEVAVSVRAEHESVVVEVADGGPGLSAEDAAVAFERGVLRARYRDIRPVGTGLGLSIAARLAGRLGGSIAAGSSPDGGALFTVTLPRG